MTLILSVIVGIGFSSGCAVFGFFLGRSVERTAAEKRFAAWKRSLTAAELEAWAQSRRMSETFLRGYARRPVA